MKNTEKAGNPQMQKRELNFAEAWLVWDYRQEQTPFREWLNRFKMDEETRMYSIEGLLDKERFLLYKRRMLLNMTNAKDIL